KLAEEVAGYSVEYVGAAMTVDGFAIEHTAADAAAFGACIEAVLAKSKLPLILMAQDPEVMKAGLAKVKGTKPLIYAANSENWEAMAGLAAQAGFPLAVKDGAGDLGALASLTEKLKGKGLQDLVLDPGVRGAKETLAALTQLRRLALRHNFRLLGFPIITFPGEGADTLLEETLIAAEHIAKYAGFIVLDHFDPATIYPLLVLRRNIYTDPQKPIQVTPGIYEVNGPKPESPVLVTTNFSITYFSVANEVDGSGVPSWLLIVDTEGLSVLTSWAAGKFDASTIAKAVNTFKLAEKVAHKKITIPGAVAIISGELEEELPGWEIRVGPREAVDIPNYLKVWK
ncbi:MAG: acetyl-CoA decarbonylase/synthase complex subunit gamma, partial [Chloroflexota bacterium]|nr:acetyl-CoA decarbonylase/synthase complex subunit gamma [Chloroflexota bacterium]